MNKNIRKLSFRFMLLFVRFLYDPRNELFCFLPRLWKQFKWNHIQHLNCLVQLGIHFLKVHHPKHQKCQSCQNDVNIEHNRAKTDCTWDIFFHHILPRLQHLYQNRNNKLFICNSNIFHLLVWSTHQKLRIHRVPNSKLTIEKTLTLIRKTWTIRQSTQRLIIDLSESLRKIKPIIQNFLIELNHAILWQVIQVIKFQLRYHVVHVHVSDCLIGCCQHHGNGEGWIPIDLTGSHHPLWVQKVVVTHLDLWAAGE